MKNPQIRFVAGTAMLEGSMEPVSVLVDHVTEKVFLSPEMTFGDEAAAYGNMMREILGMPDDALTEAMNQGGAMEKGFPHIYQQMKADGAFDQKPDEGGE